MYMTFAELLAQCNGAVGFHPDIEDRDERDNWVKHHVRDQFLKNGGYTRTLIVRPKIHPAMIKLVLLTHDIPYEMAHYGPAIARAFAETMKASQLYMTMESWVSHVTDPEEAKRIQRGEKTREARHDPNRKEALFITAEDPYCNPVLRSWAAWITRDDKGKPTVGPWESDMQWTEGRLTYLLPPEAYLAAGKAAPTA